MSETVRTCGAATTSGPPCRRAVAPGFTRCNLHGGHTPLARQAAQETLAAAALPSARVPLEIVSRWLDERCPVCGFPTGDPMPVLRAAQMVLDRTGFGPHATMQVTTTPSPYDHLTLAEMADKAEAFARRLRADADAHA